jgi:hypothetical protein
MLQHTLNVVNLVAATFVTMANPALTGLLIAASLMNGRFHEIVAFVMTALGSLFVLSPYILVIVTIIYVVYTLERAADGAAAARYAGLVNT